MNKQNILFGIILSFLVNFAGWNYAVMPMRRVRLARQFQVAAERQKPASERAIIRYKLKRGILKRRPSILSLSIWEWTYKVVIYSIAPGIFLVLLISRRRFLSLPSGKPVLILTGLGLVSDLFSLWWIAPATYFYLAAIAFVAKSEASSYPDPTSESLFSKARHWMDYRVEDLTEKNRRKLKRK